MSVPTDPGRPRVPWLALVALALVVLGLYARTAGHGFVDYDDPVYVSRNEVVARGLSGEGLRWAFGYHAGNWHPLTWLSHMLDVELFGLEPGPHHLVNAALHALNALLLGVALARLTGAPWSALAVAALFALHPLRVESVAWASERKDVLAGTFWMLTLLAYERYARRGGAARLALVALCLALGLLAKAMLVTLPLVLLVLDAWPLARLAPGEARRRALLEKLPLALPCLAAALATLWIQRQEGAVGTLGALGLLERLSNACLSTWIYLGKTLVPVSLGCFVPHPVTVTPREELSRVLYQPGLLALLGLLATSFFFWRQRRRRPHLLVGWLWYGIALLPVIGLVQVGQQAYADRYTYLPLIGPVLALVFELRALAANGPRARAWCVGGTLAATLALVPLTWRPIGTWSDTRTLFEHALAVRDRNYLAETTLGALDRREGRLAEARAHLERALEANKFHLEAMLELGLTLRDQEDWVGARRMLKRALRHDPANAQAQAALAQVERRIGRGDDGDS